MNDIVFWLLITVIVILTGLLTYAAVQVFIVLYEAQKLLRKINKSLDGQPVSAREALRTVRRFFHRSGDTLKS